MSKREKGKLLGILSCLHFPSLFLFTTLQSIIACTMDKRLKDKKQARMNDSNSSPQSKSEASSDQKSETTQASKKRKLVHKTVVEVKIGENVGKLKNEGAPSDRWSWRKYGQKPIKGSPHPRGYYKCSTSKGCSAKKQVERCRTDASLLIITYTSTHNHPAPDLDRPSATNWTVVSEESVTQTTDDLPPQTNMDDPRREHGEKHCHQPNEEDSKDSSPGDFHYLQSPIRHSQENVMIDQYEDPFTNLDKTKETISLIIQEEPPSCFQLMNISATKSDEYDFFDELEELPTSSFSNFMASYLSRERIPVAPS